MQNLSAPFIFQEECRMKIEHVLFPSVFFSKLRIRVLEGHFQCVYTIQFSEPTKIGSLKTDRVNGPYSEHHWDLEKVSAMRRCPSYRSLTFSSKEMTFISLSG